MEVPSHFEHHIPRYRSEDILEVGTSLGKRPAKASKVKSQREPTYSNSKDEEGNKKIANVTVNNKVILTRTTKVVVLPKFKGDPE